MSRLFDWSFSTFITLDVLKLVYMLLIVLHTIVALGLVITGFSQGVLAGLGALIMATIVWFLALILTRVYLECLVALFRIAENTSILVADSGERLEAGD
ncbi:MAG: DUF4282 domain-containing protein [Phycisphaerales bacterium JB043]